MRTESAFPWSSEPVSELNEMPVTLPAEQPWPPPMAPEAYHGPIGEIIETVGPHTESDPHGLIISLLVAFGNLIGRQCVWHAGADVHFGNLFAVLVGESGAGRKGSGWSEVRRIFQAVDPWESERIKTGASSGEGIIYQVRDDAFKTDLKTGEPICEPGVKDKRLLLLETEFAAILKQTERGGNSLSPILRNAWDRGDLENLTKNSPMKASGAHISIMGHITNDELGRKLNDTEASNGFANRFLWVCVRRSKELPEGGCLTDVEIAIMRGHVTSAFKFAMEKVRIFQRHAVAKHYWGKIYSDLSRSRKGLAGTICARAPAQVLRIAMLYAVLDRCDEIRIEHLKAGLAVWSYCEASANYIFGDALGDPVADEILGALRRSPDGMTRTELRDLFQKNKTANEISRALGVLLAAGKAASKRESAERGRPTERWFAVKLSVEPSSTVPAREW